MADTVTSHDPFKGTRRITRVLTAVSDGTGESAVVKVDVSTLVGPDGTAPTYTIVEDVTWDIQGYTQILLAFDATTDDKIIYMSSGQGYHDFTNGGQNAGLTDPKSSGTTGDIVLTTTGAAAGSTYTITLNFRLKD